MSFGSNRMLLFERDSIIQWIGSECADSNPTLPLTGYVTLDKLLNLSVLNGDKNTAKLIWIK